MCMLSVHVHVRSVHDKSSCTWRSDVYVCRLMSRGCYVAQMSPLHYDTCSFAVCCCHHTKHAIIHLLEVVRVMRIFSFFLLMDFIFFSSLDLMIIAHPDPIHQHIVSATMWSFCWCVRWCWCWRWYWCLMTKAFTMYIHEQEWKSYGFFCWTCCDILLMFVDVDAVCVYVLSDFKNRSSWIWSIGCLLCE